VCTSPRGDLHNCLGKSELQPAGPGEYPGGSAHILRHTLATNLLRAGVDIVVVAELLGHTRLDTTRRYTLPTHADLEDAVSHLPTDQ
jgi:integrase/recombinase XerC